MEQELLDSRRVNELRKLKSLIEWDLPNINNEALKAWKMSQLNSIRKELDALTVRIENNLGG